MYLACGLRDLRLKYIHPYTPMVQRGLFNEIEFAKSSFALNLPNVKLMASSVPREVPHVRLSYKDRTDVHLTKHAFCGIGDEDHLYGKRTHGTLFKHEIQGSWPPF